MRIVSPVLKTIVYPALAAAGIFHRMHASGLAIVTYHGVRPPGYVPIDAAFDGNLVSADVLRGQVGLLKSYYNVICPEEFLDWRQNGHGLPPKAVLLTCDDGLLNCLTDMLPVLQQESVKCLFFVTGASATDVRSMLWYEELFLLFLKGPAGLVDISSEGITIRGTLDSREQRRAVWWDSVQRLSQVNVTRRACFIHSLRDRFAIDPNLVCLGDLSSPSCRRYGLLTGAEVRQLISAGMSIGAHTLSHPMLSQLPPALAYEEIADSRTRLESALNRTVWAFAYPFGDAQSVTPQVLAMPREAGYQAALLNFGGGLGSGLPPYALPRIHVTAAMRLSELEAHVSGFYTRLQRCARRSVLGGMS